MSDPYARLQVTKKEGNEMATMTIPVSLIDNEEIMVCVFCDTLAGDLPYCASCMDYKGMMTIPDWENYTGEVWED